MIESLLYTSSPTRAKKSNSVLKHSVFYFCFSFLESTTDFRYTKRKEMINQGN